MDLAICIDITAPIRAGVNPLTQRREIQDHLRIGAREAVDQDVHPIAIAAIRAQIPRPIVRLGLVRSRNSSLN